MNTDTRDLNRRIVAKVAASLAEDLYDHDEVGVSLEKVRVEVVPGHDQFLAEVSLDDRNEDGAVITVGLSFVASLRRAVAKLETGVDFDVAEDGTGELLIHPLLESALKWLILHEAAHWTAGHLDTFRSGRSPARTSRLLAVENAIAGGNGENDPPPIDAARFKCMELEADFIATQTLDLLYADEWMEDERAGLAARKHRDPGKPQWALSDKRRIVALASAMIILMVESIRQHGRPALTHPSPDARAINIMITLYGQALIQAGEVVEGSVRVRPRDAMHIRDLIGGLAGLFHIDLAPFAASLGIAPIFGLPHRTTLIDADGDLVTMTATMHDMTLLLMDPNVAADEMRTEGAREYLELRALHRLKL